jgi:hypothetical protein
VRILYVSVSFPGDIRKPAIYNNANDLDEFS